MIPYFIQLWEVRIVLGESRKILLAEGQVVELVLEDDTCMEEGILQNLMGSGFLLFCERYLCQIVGWLMGIQLGWLDSFWLFSLKSA